MSFLRSSCLVARMQRQRTVLDKTQTPHRVRVEVIAGPDRGQVYERSSATVAFGTSHVNDIVLTDPTVSHYHMEIRGGQGVLITDLGSERGVYVNDIQIQQAVVPFGARVRLGETVLLLLEGVRDDVTTLQAALLVPGIVGSSRAMREIVPVIIGAVNSNTPVLMQGEVGSGKEFLARAIHDAGHRANAPFVTVPSDAITPEAIASHLFGVVGGAMAEGRQEGAFELANGGSIYLDEVGELPHSAQLALTDALDSQPIQQNDAVDCVQLGVRVFAATRRDLRPEANLGSFEADLYARLATTRIEVPPLRERQADLDELVEDLARELTGVPDSPFSAPIMQLLCIRWWSGNVRELREVVESAILTRNVAPESTPPPISETFRQRNILPYRLERRAAIAAFERNYLSQLIEASGGNASGAARAAGMDRPYLLSLLRKHGLR